MAETGQQQETQERERGRGSGQQAAAAVKILYSNVQSVFNKLNEPAAYAAEENPDFILLTETWCNDTINNAALSLPGYQLETNLRRDRENTTNGIGVGLLVYTRDGIKVTTCE